MTAAAVLVLAAFFAGRLATGRPDLTSELVNSHVRSLIGNHLIDVVSSDRHTVKPWFAGKVDLTATPYDFKPQGFPLAGGRLDYLGGKPVPVFVYDHGKHVVNVYVLPSDMHIADAVVRGFSIVTWPDHDLEFVAISDAGAAELKQLEQLYRQQ
jgi:anti-sigma factor RsiW